MKQTKQNHTVFKRITDHGAMKLNNQLSILRTIREQGPISRVKLQRATSLSWGTITSSIKELIDSEIVKETGPVATGVGRRPVELDMNTARNYAVGVRLGAAHVSSVALDAKGNLVGEWSAPVDSNAGVDETMESLFEAVTTVLKGSHISLKRVVGIGMAAPGALDVEKGMSLYAPHHPGWANVPVVRLFERRFHKPCFIDHVNNCSALGEMWFGLGRGVKNFLCVLLGTGISVGIIINGEVYRGLNFAAGEFGHTTIDPEGPPCECGSRGCLEVYATGPAIAKSARELVAADPSSEIHRMVKGRLKSVSAELVSKAAATGDPVALEVFDRMGRFLGIGLSNLINLFNPERIVLCGAVSQSSEHFMSSLEETLEGRAWHISQKDIRVSRMQNGAVLGAAVNVLQAVYNSDLLLGSQNGTRTPAQSPAAQ